MSKSYTYQPTKHAQLFRVVDRNENWEHYAFVREFAEDYDPKAQIGPHSFKDVVYLRGATTILSKGYAKGAFFEEWLLKITPQERDEILHNAGERGDKVHRAIDNILSYEMQPQDFQGTPEEWAALKESGKMPVVIERELGVYNRNIKDYEPLSNKEWDDIITLNKFWAAHDPIILKTEMPTYNVAEGYAGTMDAILILTKACSVKTCKCDDLVGKIGLYDWKTASGIRPSYSAQLAAYTNADNIGEYLPTGRTIEYNAILRLGTQHKTTGGYEFKVYDLEAVANGMARFRGAKLIADYEYKPFDPAIDIEDIPDNASFMIERFNFDAQPIVEAKSPAEVVAAAIEAPTSDIGVTETPAPAAAPKPKKKRSPRKKKAA